MKKIFILAVAAIAALTANAQTKHTVNIWIDGEKTTIENVDSLTFTEDTKATMEYVDLGLSVKWATCNLGATKEDETGNYYSWGETETKTDYVRDNWKFADGSKYNDEDNKLELDPEDDAATAALGAEWKTPNYDEVQELIDNCDWAYTEDKAVKGFTGTSKKNGKTIFIPLNGGMDEWGLDYVGKYMELWTSERPQGKDKPYYIFGVKYNVNSVPTPSMKINNTETYPGLGIRPVYVGK